MPVDTNTTEREDLTPANRKAAIRLAALIFAAQIVMLLAIGVPLTLYHVHELRDEETAKARNRMALVERVVHAEYNKIVSDTNALASLPTLPLLITSHGLDPSHRLVNYLSRILLNDKRYDQLRVLNEQGFEQMRIVHRDERTFYLANDMLRDRSDAGYFRDTLQLLPGQIYVSPITINAGADAVEHPNIPMIRTASQIQDAAGKLRGVMVLDYNAQGLMDSVGAVLVNAPNEYLTITNQHGQPIMAIRQGKSTLPPREELTGTGDGVTITTRLYPLQINPTAIPNVYRNEDLGVPPTLAEKYQWTLTTHLPNATWESAAFVYQPAGRVLVAALLALFAFAAYETANAWVYRRQLRRDRETHLRELEDLYERAPCGYHTIDSAGTVLRMNETELGWLGYSHDEVVATMPYTALLAPEARTHYLQNFDAIRRQQAVHDFRIVLQRKDGSTFPASIHAYPVYDAQGEFIGNRVTAIDVTDRHALELELKRQAFTDPLTGVFNRRHFFALGERHWRHAQRNNMPVALLMIDIDLFKSINDTYGHEAGDKVLQTMAQRCMAMLRPLDLFARLGGEEFAVLLPEAGLLEARQVAERLRQTLADTPVWIAGDATVRFTVSIGSAKCEAGDTGLDDLMRRADKQLYLAKQAGRNRIF